MKPGLTTEDQGCAAGIDAADAHHWETESPNTSEITMLLPRENPCELFEGGLGI
jgi:hypothetical protein